jgi:phage/plasmid-like protein (TIGR03299 family)
MSHEITDTDCMVSGNNVTPWHGLGVQVDGNLAAADALAAARLNWEVEKEPVFDADMREIASHRLTRRSDTRDVLGVVSKGWEPVQNATLLEIAEALAQVDCEFRPVIETAGSLRGGRLVWCLVKTGEREFAGSRHAAYLLLSNSHDGTRGLRGTLTDVRVVCANTLRCAESERAALFLTHTKNIHERIHAAIDALDWANEATNATFAIYAAMQAERVSEATARRFFARTLDTSEASMTRREADRCDAMFELFRDGPGCEGRTVFDALQAVTDWVDHHREMRDDETRQERRFISSAFGEGARLKSRAFTLAKNSANFANGAAGL